MVLELDQTQTDNVAYTFPIETTLDLPRHRSIRCHAGEFTAAEVVVVEAWAYLIPGVESFHLGQFQDGGACIWLLVRDTEAPETLATWLIWPEAEQILVKTIGPKSRQSGHRTLRSALQAVTSASPVQWHSVALIADAMLASRSPPDLTQAPAPELKVAA